MSFYTEQRTKSLETEIREHLTNKRLQNPNDYTVPTLALYEHITRDVLSDRNHPIYFGLPTGIFNKIVGDMKKVGIVGTAKGGEVVFLSNAAWELHQQQRRQTSTPKPFGDDTAEHS